MKKRALTATRFLEENPTTDLVNVVKDPNALAEALQDLNKKVREAREDRDVVAFHQEKLGKQSFCFVSEFRHYVWNRPTWRLFVSRFKGISLEIPLVDASHIKAWEALQDYRKAIGL